MISVGSVQKIYLYLQPTDMRKSFEGLSRLVREHYPGELLSGALFIFLNRRRHLIKILYWDRDGLAVWNKRLEEGRFQLPETASNTKMPLSRREFLAFLEGVKPLKFEPRYDRQKERQKRLNLVQNTAH